MVSSAKASLGATPIFFSASYPRSRGSGIGRLLLARLPTMVWSRRLGPNERGTPGKARARLYRMAQSPSLDLSFLLGPGCIATPVAYFSSGVARSSSSVACPSIRQTRRLGQHLLHLISTPGFAVFLIEIITTDTATIGDLLRGRIRFLQFVHPLDPTNASVILDNLQFVFVWFLIQMFSSSIFFFY